MATPQRPNVTCLTLPGEVENPRSQIDWQQRSVTVFGKVHPQPRLTRWYGPVPYLYSGLRWEADPIPSGLNEILREVEYLTGERFNSVLCNLYRDGQDGISWHSDDEALFGDDPIVASVSFGATRTFKLRSKTTKEVLSYDLTDHSLLVMGRGVQKGWMHSVPRTSQPTGERVNLTFRLTVVNPDKVQRKNSPPPWLE